MHTPIIRMASCTEAGARHGNEDALACGQSRHGHFAVLCDGAGGHQRGAEAAQRAVACMARLLGDDAVAFSATNLSRMVHLAHSELLHHQTGEGVAARMHCTVVAFWLAAESQLALWTHVGDSRLYRLRGAQVDLLTADDSVVFRMWQAGLINAEQMQEHPQKNQLIAALGMEGEVEPHTVLRPVEACPGDAYLLCSDGWWDHFDGTQLHQALQRALDPAAWLADLRGQITDRAKPRQDNFSAVALWVGEPHSIGTEQPPDDTLPSGRLALT